jgi:hypothetical protein
MNLKTVAIVLSTVTSTTPALAGCKISQSIYRDVDGKGFELVFKPATGSGFGGAYGTAIIQQAKLGRLYNFSFTQANGYGSMSLISLKPDGSGFADGDFGINFFDASLKSPNTSFNTEANAPKYAFISGLGSHDYYRRRSSSGNNLLLKDTMWVYSRCQSKRSGSR